MLQKTLLHLNTGTHHIHANISEIKNEDKNRTLHSLCHLSFCLCTFLPFNVNWMDGNIT